jgi:alkylmercury lyase-like protein
MRQLARSADAFSGRSVAGIVDAVTPDDLAIRNVTYRRFVELGRAPTPDEVASGAGRGIDDVRDAWQRLHEAHALVLDDGGRVLMANPFSAVETPHRVEAAGRTWYANCGWDAFGIGVALRTDSTIRTTCPDCAEPIELEVRGYRPTDPSPVFHVLLPAHDWWTDIGFT